MEVVKVLLEWFGELIQAPADVEKLNTAVLQWAVQGRLVEQDPNDESAVVLFERITTAKQVSSAEKKNKKENPLPINDAESLHELPLNWQWVSLRQIGELNPRNQAQDDLKVSFIPMRCISEKYGDPLQTETRAWREIKSGYTHVQENDVVLAKITPCFENGKSVVMEGLANGIGAGTTELHVFRSNPSFIVPHYVLLFFKSPRFMSVGQTQMTGTAGQKRLPGNYVANAPFPLPPYEEQKRIVAKVEAVLGQTGVLARQMGEVEEKRKATRQAALRRLVTAVSQTEVATAWEFIAQHFHDLYTEPEAVQELKQAILQLAVQGRLVPQDPNDEETAAGLLEQIAAERENFIETGKIPQIDLSTLTNQDLPYQVPPQWAWAKLGEITDAVSGVTKGRNLQKEETIILPYLRVANVQRGYLDLSIIKEIEVKTGELEKYRLKYGDLLLTEGGDADKLGRGAIWKGEIRNCIHQNHVYRARPLHPNLSSEWLMLCTNSQYGKDYFLGSAKQTTNLASINMTQLRNFPVVLPHFSNKNALWQK